MQTRFGLSTILFGLLALLLSSQSASAQVTQSQIEQCSASIKQPGFQDPYYWSTSDTSSFNMVYTYDYSLCKGIPIASVYAGNFDTNEVYSCNYTQFSAAQSWNSVCKITRGYMADQALNGDYPNWDINIRMGVRPTFYTRTDVFGVVGSEDPVTSTSTTATTSTYTSTVSQQAQRRRRRAVVAQEVLGMPSDMVCEVGHVSCPVKSRKGIASHKCLDLSRNLFACGGCPGTPGSQDCSEIPGVSNVQCVSGVCQVKACDRKHKLSPDGKSCIEKEVVPLAKRSKVY